MRMAYILKRKEKRKRTDTTEGVDVDTKEEVSCDD
jgi:hypothetical protein